MSAPTSALPATRVPPLAARLAPPALRPQLVTRARLVCRLQAGLEPAVHLVHAPPGFGKSTLIAQLAEADDRPLVWLTLDERDADPVTLITDVVFALAGVDDLAVDVLEGVAGGPSAVVPSVLPRLVRLIAEAEDERLMILDDVHEVRSPEARDVLRAIVDHVPPGSSLVLAGRARPDLPIARLSASGRLVELGAPDLRMTVAEGSAMLRNAGVVVDAEEVEMLVRRTEGWPAALYLAAVALRDAEPNDLEELVGGPGSQLVDYFREEVLSGASADDTRFLLESSILEELRAADCDAILERSDSAERLASLAQANLFVTPLAMHGEAYRVHGLFREDLLAELRRLQPGRAPALHRRAAARYAEQGDVERAVRHALAGGDPATAADLIWSVSPEYESRGRSATLKRWLEMFAPEHFHEYPSLALTAGWAAIDDGDGDSAEHWVTVALAAPADAVLSDGTPMAAAAGLLDAALGKRGVRAVAEAAASSDALLPPGSPWKCAAKFLRGAAAYLADDADTARTVLLDGQAAAASRVPAVYVLCLTELALMAIDADAWEEAESLIGRARLSQRTGQLQDYATQGIFSATTALVHAHRSEPQAARPAMAAATRALAAHRHLGPWLAAQARLVLARAHLALGDPAPARELLREARQIAEADPGATRLHDGVEEVASDLEALPARTADGEVITIAELRTMQYLPTHLSLREIGDRLRVSRNTVKTHTISIYRKLNVSSRSEAVDRGRELGLLDG